MKLRCPALPLASEAKWAHVRGEYAAVFPHTLSHKNVGLAFVQTLQGLLKAIGEHYKGESLLSKPGSGGNVKAFEAFFREMQQAVPKHPGVEL